MFNGRWIWVLTGVLCFFFAILIHVGGFSDQRSQAVRDLPELTIATYQSWVAEGGVGSVLFPLFEKKNRCRIRVLVSDDGGGLLTRLELDAKRGKHPAQIILGIDQLLWQQAKPLLEKWNGWQPSGYSELIESLKIEEGFLPYDFGVLAFMADRNDLKKLGLQPPESVLDLSRPQWRRNFILEDPRTSTPGLSFLLYSHSVLGAATWNWWNQLRSQWLTIAPTWDSAYGLFIKGEAPLVWSYLTSQAYHVEHGQKNQYEAVLFKEGQPVQIEGAAWVRGAFENSQQRELAKKFFEFLISEEAQKVIPLKVWMMPARRGIELPESFRGLPHPAHLVTLPTSREAIQESLRLWKDSLLRE